MTIVRPPSQSVSTSPSSPAASARGASAPSAKMIGTSARSSKISMASADRPTGPVVPTIGSTSAVEDNASAMPRPSAPASGWPIRLSAKPITNPEARSCAEPSPNTWTRIAHRRLNDSSSPMVNSSITMPNSANGSIASRSVMVM